MEKLRFQRKKYGKELLIDACNEEELDIVDDTLILDFYTVILVDQGQGTFYIDAEKVLLQDQSILFIKPGQRCHLVGTEFVKCHLLFFEGDFLDEFFSDRDFIYKFSFFHNPDQPSFMVLEEDRFRNYYQIAEEIREEILSQDVDSTHILRSLIYYLLVRLNQSYAQLYGTSRGTLSHPTVLAFLKLLDRHIKEERTVSAYADQLSISRVQLNNLCQRHFSKTAQQVIRERSISDIKAALLRTSTTLSEIAYDFNFSAPAHFSRFVKQMTGLTPQELRKSLS